MNTNSMAIQLWTCPKCGRQFQRKGQSHSCKLFPIQQHFKAKPRGKKLYEVLCREIKKYTGPFKLESLECCIHFTTTFTFAAVHILSDRIRVEFSLEHKITNTRITDCRKLSAHRYLHFIDITQEEDINEELMGWIKEAHHRDQQRHKIYSYNLK